MFTRIVSLAGIVGWRTYSEYSERKAERLARMQQKVEEVTVTTIEGWTVKEIAAALEKQGLGTATDFTKAADAFDANQFALAANRPSKAGLEGYLFPDTYRFVKTSTPEMILQKMLANFSSRLTSIEVSADTQRYTIPGYEDLAIIGGDNQPGISLYDIITLASIIEQESGGKGAVSDGSLSLDEERRLVAGVFYNRLTIGQALESDATVNYVTGKNTPAASGADLAVNSPYNTYKYPGLPPGPICNPSLGSIKAALNPAKSDYYFFLHKQPSGKVEFSKTFEEHKRAKVE